MGYALPMDTIKIQKHLDAVESLKGQYQAIQEKRIRNYRGIAVSALALGFALGVIVGVSYRYQYGYSVSGRIEMHELQEVDAVEVHSA
jgi:hypothetical protein